MAPCGLSMRAAMERVPREVLAARFLPAVYTGLQHKGYYMPCRNIMAGMHGNLLEMLEHRALWTVRYLLSPVCLLWIAKRKADTFTRERKAVKECVSAQQVMSLLRKSEIFQLWPERALQPLAEGATGRSFMRGEFIFYHSEPSSSIAILVRGTAVESVRTPDDPRKAFIVGSETPTVQRVATWAAPFVYGEYAILAEELKPYVRADETCDVLFISADLFVNALKALAPGVKAAISEASLRQKKTSMLTKTFTADELLTSPFFLSLPHESLDEVARHFQPEVMPRGTTVVGKGQFGKAIYYLLSGHCECTMRTDDGVTDPVVVARYKAGEFFGEFSNAQQEVKTLSLCEVWMLPRNTASINALLSKRDNKEADRLARLKRLRALQQVKASMHSVIYTYAAKHLPLYAAVLDPPELRALIALFEPEVHVRGDVILSKTAVADRMIVITDGTPVKVQDGGRGVKRGTFFGYTCLLQHRWTSTLAAKGNVDAWSLPRLQLLQFLQGKRKYDIALRLCMLMLQPNLSDKCLPPLPKSLLRLSEKLKRGEVPAAPPPARRGSRAHSTASAIPAFYTRVLMTEAAIRKWSYLFSAGDDSGRRAPEVLYDRMHPIDMASDRSMFPKASIDVNLPVMKPPAKKAKGLYRFSSKTAAMHSQPKGVAERAEDAEGGAPKKAKTVVFEAGTADPQGARGGRNSLASAASQRTLKSKSSFRSFCTSAYGSSANFDNTSTYTGGMSPRETRRSSAVGTLSEVATPTTTSASPHRSQSRLGGLTLTSRQSTVRKRISFSIDHNDSSAALTPRPPPSLPRDLSHESCELLHTSPPATACARPSFLGNIEMVISHTDLMPPAADAGAGVLDMTPPAAPSPSPVRADLALLQAARCEGAPGAAADRPRSRVSSGGGRRGMHDAGSPESSRRCRSASRTHARARHSHATGTTDYRVSPLRRHTSRQRAFVPAGGAFVRSLAAMVAAADSPVAGGGSSDASSGSAPSTPGAGSDDANRCSSEDRRRSRVPAACAQPTPPPPGVHFHNYIPCALPHCGDEAHADADAPRPCRPTLWDAIFSL